MISITITEAQEIATEKGCNVWDVLDQILEEELFGGKDTKEFSGVRRNSK
jgi:hypothetical protein